MDSSFLSFFLDEASDIVASWEKSCLEFEKSQNHEAAENLYRCAHNLKSGSAAVGLEKFSTFVHHVEELLSKLLAGKITPSLGLLHLFFEVHTLLATWLENIRLDTSFAPEGELLKVEQTLDELCANPSEGGGGAKSQDDTPSQPSDPKAPVEKALEPASEIGKPVEAILAENKGVTSTSRPAENIRVSANKLDMLIQLVGELSTQQAIVWHGRQNGSLHSKGCDNAIQLIQKNAKDLHAIALSLRMQSLHNLFQRLERAARDLARTQGKKIEVITHGEHVELDRTVIERITEALMHVIRNAIDHGIEDAKAREESGKPLCATLYLAGSQEPGGVLITISEDGRGLNLERILNKAIEKGLAKADQKYSPAEIQRFIFLQGFSTAEKVTDISGRGVGMDVVKASVQAIGGSINVSSRAGHGTAFAISLPASLSIVDALIIELDHIRYAVPVQDVSEIVDLTSFKLETISSRGRLLSLRQSVIPVESLRDHLPKNRIFLIASSKASKKRNDSIRPALLVRTGKDVLAFEIDAIAGQQPVSMKPLPGNLEKVVGYTGGSILGDGDPCVILNLPVLARNHIETLHGQIDEMASSQSQAVTSAGNVDANADAIASKHLIFRIHEHLLAIPLLAAHEILSHVPYAKMLGSGPHVLGCFDMRGRILTIIDLAVVLGLPALTQPGPMIVVNASNTLYALMVDKIEAVSDIAHVQEREADPCVGKQESSLLCGVSYMVRHKENMLSVIDLSRIFSEMEHWEVAV